MTPAERARILSRLPSEREIQRELIRRDLKEYTDWSFQNINGAKFEFNWHHNVIIDALHAVYAGDIQRLLITLPPRHTKTELVVKQFIPWALTKSPNSLFLHVSYSHALALKNSHAIKSAIDHPEFKKMFPIRLDRAERSKNRWSLTSGGGMYAVSSMGAVTGEGAGRKDSETFSGAVVADDLIKAGDELRELMLEKTWTNFQNVLSSRRNRATIPVILIMQRLHEADVAGMIEAGESVLGPFEHICLQGIREDATREFHDCGEVRQAETRRSAMAYDSR